MTLIDILTVVVLILVSALIIFLIVYLEKITRSIQNLQKDISELSDKLEPLVTSLADFTYKLSVVSDQVRNQLDTTKDVIYNVKKHIDKILEFEEKVRAGIEGPVSGILNQIKAISNGVNTFLNYLKK